MDSSRSVAIDLGVHNGTLALYARGLGSYVIDPKRLSLVERPYGEGESSARPLDATIGLPMVVQWQGPYRGDGWPPTEYRMDIILHAPPAPGIYALDLQADDGFARTDDGSALMLGDWGGWPESWPVELGWPDERNGDRRLAQIRDRLVGKDVFGYGGITIVCPRISWDYSQTTPLRVRSVDRERGQLRRLWTGTTTHWGSDWAPHFEAFEPLRIVVDKPAANPSSWSGGGDSSAEACPAIVLADWQVDVALSLRPPPTIPNDPNQGSSIAIGMSRDDVAWRRGYPNEFAGLAAFRRERIWSYGSDIKDPYTVTFRNDRVVSFTTPPRGP
jgi:hypothetical protein